MYSKIKIPIKGDLYEFVEFSQLIQDRISEFKAAKPKTDELLLISYLETVEEKVSKVLQTPIMGNKPRKITINLPELVSIKTQIIQWGPNMNVFMAQVDQAAVNLNNFYVLESISIGAKVLQLQLDELKTICAIPLLTPEVRYSLDLIFKTTLQVLNITDYSHRKKDKFSLLVRYLVMETFLNKFPGHESALAGYFAKFMDLKNLDRTTIVHWQRRFKEMTSSNYMDVNNYLQKIANRLVNPEIN